MKFVIRFICFFWQYFWFLVLDVPFVLSRFNLLRTVSTRVYRIYFRWKKWYMDWSFWNSKWEDSWYDGEGWQKWYSYKTYRDYTTFLIWAKSHLFWFLIRHLAYPLNVVKAFVKRQWYKLVFCFKFPSYTARKAVKLYLYYIGHPFGFFVADVKYLALVRWKKVKIGSFKVF